VLLVMTGAAIGGGWFAGNYLNGENKSEAAAASADHGAPAKAGDAHGAADAHGDEKPVNELLVDLSPMTTNLAAPSQVWIRLEASLVLDVAQPPEMIETIHQDLLAYLRTVKMHQIEGASGYQHLKADLEERARIRSDGHVRQVLVRTLLLE
jgi:flagellar FliL protein